MVSAWQSYRLTGARDVLEGAFREVIELLREEGVPFWLDSGTLLGLVRDGKPIEDDDDLDISTYAANEPDFVRLAEQLRRRGWSVESTWYQGRRRRLKLYPPSREAPVEQATAREPEGRATRAAATAEHPPPGPPGGRGQRQPAALGGRERVIDVTFFWRCGRYFWSPVVSYRGWGWQASRVWYAWLRLLGRAVLALRGGVYPQRVDRGPWSLVFGYGVWWVPERFLTTLAREPKTGLPIPAQTEEYLRLRYGDWRTPRGGWEFYRHDGLYVERARAPECPVVIPGSTAEGEEHVAVDRDTADRC